jgi:hypothetical protein
MRTLEILEKSANELRKLIKQMTSGSANIDDYSQAQKSYPATTAAGSAP